MRRIRRDSRRFHRSRCGMSILEMLVATVLASIVIGAALEYYVTQHRAWLMQDDVSEVQHNARACLDEIATKLRMAGYGLPGGHPPYAIGQDSITIYARADLTIDTTLYYVVHLDSLTTYLVRELPGTGPQIFADGIENLSIVSLGGSLLRVSLTARSDRSDVGFLGGDGYRRRQLSTDVRARNLGL